MEIEVVRTGRGGLQQRDRRPPVVGVCLPDREVVTAGEAGEIGGRDQRLAGDVLEVTRELGPEGGLQIDVLAHGDGAHLGEGRHHLGGRAVEAFQALAPDQHGQVMLAERGAARDDVVLGAGQVGAQGDAVVIGGLHPAQGQVHPLQGRLAVDEAEALGDDHLARQAQQVVQHPRRGLGGVVLDRDHGPEAARQGAGAGQFQRLQAKAGAAVRQVLAGVALRDQHRAHLAIVEAGQEFQRLGAAARRAVIDAQHAGAVGRERRDQAVTRAVQLAAVGGLDGGGLGLAGPLQGAQETVDDAAVALQRAADDGEEQVVDVELPGREALAPGGVEIGAEGVRERALRAGVDLAADHVVVDGEPRAGETAQHHVAHGLAVVQFLAVGRLERQAGQVDDLHQEAIARLQRDVVQVAGVRQALSGRHFLLRVHAL